VPSCLALICDTVYVPNRLDEGERKAEALSRAILLSWARAFEESSHDSPPSGILIKHSQVQHVSSSYSDTVDDLPRLNGSKCTSAEPPPEDVPRTGDVIDSELTRFPLISIDARLTRMALAGKVCQSVKEENLSDDQVRSLNLTPSGELEFDLGLIDAPPLQRNVLDSACFQQRHASRPRPHFGAS
jgi:hypothetical protein